jgi:hypothetical protein
MVPWQVPDWETATQLPDACETSVVQLTLEPLPELQIATEHGGVAQAAGAGKGALK